MLNLYEKEIEIIDVNYSYKFISERESKSTSKIIVNVSPNVDRYNYSINNMMFGIKVTEDEAGKLIIIDN
ncbi:MAG TPA: hypothetical protein VJ767_02430 [Nitrososphaeraceae archaeon]|nr:hypothetical protein [Nitrososphaeraceae archaeon]